MQNSLSVFKYYINEAKKRRKSLNLTPDFLEELWQSQNGKCAVSGLEIKLRGDHNDIFDLASLDRIDSSKGYVKDNIQFVVLALNLAKNSQDNDKFVKFLKKLAKKVGSK